MELLGPDELEFSSTVANCSMNRERQLHGSNSYSRDLRFDIAAWLTERARMGSVHWVDLCCGSGRALIEAADVLSAAGLESQVSITGIDLAGLFLRPAASRLLTLQVQSVEAWTPQERLSLITCVHGLH